MNLSPKQKGALFGDRRKPGMLPRAWQSFARAQGQRENDSVAKEAFRKAVLKASTGLDSLRDLPKAGPLYGRFMAALEQIAGDGYKWTMHVDSGSADAAVDRHSLRKLIRTKNLDERYVRGIAQQALQCEELPVLHELNAEDAETVLGVVRAQEAKGLIPQRQAAKAKAASDRAGLARCAKCGPVKPSAERHYDAARKQSFNVPTCPHCRGVCAPMVIALGDREAVAA